MNQPHVWIRSAVESAVEGLTAWPMQNTARVGSQGYDPPYVVYLRTGTLREELLAETLGDPPGDDLHPPTATFTIEVYADLYATAWQMANAIVHKINRFRGESDGEVIEAAYVTDVSDSGVIVLEGREQVTYVIEIQVSVLYQE